MIADPVISPEVTPFGPIYQHWVEEGRCRLERRCSLITTVEAAWPGLRAALENRLHEVSWQTIYPLYEKTGRIPGSYNSFVGSGVSGWKEIFSQFPMLEELIWMVLEQWAEVSSSMLNRLAADQNLLGLEGVGLVDLRMLASDRHDHGQSVASITFGDGSRWIYKPRDISAHLWLNDLMRWIDLRSDFSLGQVPAIGRDGYGWIKYVPHLTPVDPAVFYLHAGMMLCLADVMCANDLHYENVRACGDRLLILDSETFLRNSPVPMPGAIEPPDCFTPDTLLATGMLPRWVALREKLDAPAVDISGLGAPAEIPSLTKVPCWENTGSDDIRMTLQQTLRKECSHLPGPVNEIGSHCRQVKLGFARMFLFLMHKSKELLEDSTSPLAVLGEVRSRFIFRPTLTYRLVLERSFTPGFLTSKEAWEESFSILATPAVLSAPHAREIYFEEKEQLQRLDVPVFMSSPSSLDLELSIGRSRAFSRAGGQLVRRNMRALRRRLLHQKLRLIQVSIDARHGCASRTGRTGRVADPELSAVEQAERIGRHLLVTGDEKSGTWFGVEYDVGMRTFQLARIDNSLYGGRAGIAVFFAALGKVTGSLRHAALAERLIGGCVAVAPQDTARAGFTYGPSGLIRACMIIYSITGNEFYLECATNVMGKCGDALLCDGTMDFMSGLPGRMAALLALGEVYTNTAITEVMDRISGKLLEGARSFLDPDHVIGVAAGLSHGCAGVTAGVAKLAAAGFSVPADLLGGLCALEDKELDEKRGWPDARQAERVFNSSWCNGNTGIAYSRRIHPSATIHQELAHRLAYSDSLPLDLPCCGEFGRINYLITAGMKEAAHEAAERVLHRAAPLGGFACQPCLGTQVQPPGLVNGLAGIGYSLLRLDLSDYLPDFLQP